MRKSKKGVELTLNTIIIAAICLVVLFVVLAIFTDVLSNTVQDIFRLSSCASKGGRCEPTRGLCEQDIALFKFGGCGKADTYGDWCCIPDD